MSIRTNPMKAVPLLLRRLERVEERAVNLKDLKSELIKIKDLFFIVKQNEKELLDTLSVVDSYLRNFNIPKLMREKEEICKRIRNSTQKLLPAAEIQSSNIEAAGSSGKTFEDVKVNKRDEVSRALPSSPQLEDLETFKVNYKNLDHIQKYCFLSLLLFPENAVIKKRNIILWWTGAGEDKDGEVLFNELLHHKLIVPHCQGKCPVVNKFKVNPWVRHESMSPLLKNDEHQFCHIYSQIVTSPPPNYNRYDCLSLDQQKVELSEGFAFECNHWRAVFNVGASYLNFGPQWMAKMKRLEVLQLGRWLKDSPRHHIEVKSEEFLKELRGQKNLKYLSLRGISRIFELPSSIFKLESLETLDLKACHHLETLPGDIASLRNLRHLDLSQCYCLERMPKGIEKLTKLEVLKGFVKGKTPCTISDLAHLSKLKQLSIHIGSEAVIHDKEFESLEELLELEKLKISWGGFGTRYGDIQISLPSNLKKLHLEGFPRQEIPEWLKPSKLPEALTKLYISGGKLRSMNHGETNNHWHVEMVHLKYLKHLKVDLTNLQELFPLLRYAEIKQISNHSYFEWSID